MRAIVSDLNGGDPEHAPRFAIASFLVACGWNDEEIHELFLNVADYDESVTRRQIEQIRRGDYTPMSCRTMDENGLCVNKDALCSTISHPLQYYRAKGGETVD